MKNVQRISFTVNMPIFFLLIIVMCYVQEAEKSKGGKTKHSKWRNYDDLNEYFWYHASSQLMFLISITINQLNILTGNFFF